MYKIKIEYPLKALYYKFKKAIYLLKTNVQTFRFIYFLEFIVIKILL